MRNITKTLQATVGATLLAATLAVPSAVAQPHSTTDFDFGDTPCFGGAYCSTTTAGPQDDTFYVDMRRPRITLSPLRNDFFFGPDLEAARVEIDEVPEGYSLVRIDEQNIELRMTMQTVVKFEGVNLTYRVTIDGYDCGSAEIEVLPLPR